MKSPKFRDLKLEMIKNDIMHRGHQIYKLTVFET